MSSVSYHANLMVIMMVTNGILILITIEVAERIASMGNIVPAISMEGWQERTDARRSKGIYAHVLYKFAGWIDIALVAKLDAGIIGINRPSAGCFGTSFKFSAPR